MKLGQHWDILGWEYWDKNHWKRVWSCCRIFWVWDNLLWISNFSFSRKGSEGRRFGSIKFHFLAASGSSVLLQVPFSGSPHSFGNPQPRFYGPSGVSNHPWELIPQKLIPLLQAVLHTLEENRKNNLSPESPGKREEKGIATSLILFFYYFNFKSRKFSI